MERSTNSQCLCIYSGKFEVVVFSIFWSIMSGQSGVTAWMPAITAGINMIGNVVGSIWGAKPVPPPVAAPLPPPPPPQIEYRPVPGAPPETIYITQAPLPPPTAAPETLSYLGIIALVIMVLFVLACCASGIGFFFWQSQKAEKVGGDVVEVVRVTVLVEQVELEGLEEALMVEVARMVERVRMEDPEDENFKFHEAHHFQQQTSFVYDKNYKEDIQFKIRKSINKDVTIKMMSYTLICKASIRSGNLADQQTTDRVDRLVGVPTVLCAVARQSVCARSIVFYDKLFTKCLPIISGIFNGIGGLLGSGVGQPPPLPPPLPPPPPPAPPQIIHPPNKPNEIIYITQAPYPPATRAPETLTTYGTLESFFTQKSEAEKRANEAARDRDMEMGGGGRRGRRGGGYTSETTGTTGRTKTKRHKRR
ncbi:Protein CBG03694 [Caenorhabditis briggsae]|uniref:Protein CBG03694 n=1 Tax=Caenorhabditis briggsae TaxID=6238 RepID=A8WVL9_CAEBR|nr:Protein CBG03694 [Caenorhabditis briggsae]CAP24530.1 Protein CBG03694 [Caenorhabditis briggsae]